MLGCSREASQLCFSRLPSPVSGNSHQNSAHCFTQFVHLHLSRGKQTLRGLADFLKITAVSRPQLATALASQHDIVFTAFVRAQECQTTGVCVWMAFGSPDLSVADCTPVPPVAV